MKRILIVEDEALVAMMLEDMLGDLGYEVIGIASSVGEALSFIENNTVDGAILDVNLAHENSYPIADCLGDRKIPYAFGTGYGLLGVDKKYHAMATVLEKPFNEKVLNDTLVRMFGA